MSDVMQRAVTRIVLGTPQRPRFGSMLLREIVDTARVEAEVRRMLREESPALALRVDLKARRIGDTFTIDIVEVDAVTALGRVASANL